MVRNILLAASAISALVIAGPAFAQASSSTAGSAGNNNGATTSSTTDLSVQATVPIDSYNSDSSTHSSNKTAVLDSYNSDSSTHSSTKTNTLASNNTSNKTNTFDSNNTSNKTATFDSNNTSTDNSSHTKNLALDSYNTDNSQKNGNWHLVASQDLSASAAPVTTSGKTVSFSSGSNSINGGSFSTFSGILNQSWNTGLGSTTQSATNIAAQGTVNF